MHESRGTGLIERTKSSRFKMNWDRSRYETLPGQLNLSNKECVTEKERDEELQCVQKHGQWKRTPSSGVKNIKQETEIIKEKYKEDHIRGKKERYTSTRTDTRVERVARLLHNYVKRKRHKRELWVTPPRIFLFTYKKLLFNKLNLGLHKPRGQRRQGKSYRKPK